MFFNCLLWQETQVGQQTCLYICLCQTIVLNALLYFCVSLVFSRLAVAVVSICLCPVSSTWSGLPRHVITLISYLFTLTLNTYASKESHYGSCFCQQGDMKLFANHWITEIHPTVVGRGLVDDGHLKWIPHGFTFIFLHRPRENCNGRDTCIH